MKEDFTHVGVAAAWILVGALLCTARETAPAGAGMFYPVSGDLPSVVPFREIPYLVTGDITVPLGETVTIEAGAVLLFKNFTTLHVHGTLLALGTAETPVIFSSENDTVFHSTTDMTPAPYDWNGITVYEEAHGTTFRHSLVGYSLYGIKALTKEISVDQCLFVRNGRSDLSVTGEKKDVSAQPFSFNPEGYETWREEATPVVRIVKESSRRTALRYLMRTAGIIFAVGGAGTTAWEMRQYSDARRRFDALDQPENVDNLKNPEIIEKWDAARMEKERHLIGVMAGVAVGIAGAVSFGLSFTF